MDRARDVTELEGCVLGVIRTKGFCTPYAVRREFRESMTPYWSASAGAIYPLFARLIRRRMIRVTRPAGPRGGVLYALTAAGDRALLRWLGPPLDPLTAGAPADPIRTRVGFLSLLSPAARQLFLAEATDQLRRNLADLADAVAEDCPDPFACFALRGSYLVMAARLTWLREVAEALGAGTLTTQ